MSAGTFSARTGHSGAQGYRTISREPPRIAFGSGTARGIRIRTEARSPYFLQPLLVFLSTPSLNLPARPAAGLKYPIRSGRYPFRLGRKRIAAISAQPRTSDPQPHLQLHASGELVIAAAASNAAHRANRKPPQRGFPEAELGAVPTLAVALRALQ